MKTYLEHIFSNSEKKHSSLTEVIAKIKKDGLPEDAPSYKRYLKEILLCENKDAKEIALWLQKESSWMWEDHAYFLCCRMHGFKPLSKWDSAPKEYKDNYSQRVARLARELAEALEEDIRPGDIPVLLYFDDDAALNLFNRLAASVGVKINVQANDASLLLAQETESYAPQKFPSLLRRLAQGMEYVATWEIRDKRPNTGQPNARTLARYLSEYFESTYKKTPNSVIAACVRLMLPEIDPPPGEEDIRQWRGAR